MALQNIVEEIDAEISRLEQAKKLLQASSSKTVQKATVASKVATTAAGKPRKRVLSPEAIERIRAAQKRRWAKAGRAKKG
jgi:hypothetical protein